MFKLALVGRNISHSGSPALYHKLVDSPLTYELLDYKSPSEIPKLELLLSTYNAINITAPYKKHFIAELDENYSEVEGINAATLRDGKLVGTNTDFLACRELFKRYSQRYKFSSVVLLGDGVMAKLMTQVLTENNQAFTQLSRRDKNLNLVVDFLEGSPLCLIINACAREFNFQTPDKNNYIFWDLNYAHPLNATSVEGHGATYIDGQELLELQAKYALSFWNISFN